MFAAFMTAIVPGSTASTRIAAGRSRIHSNYRGTPILPLFRGRGNSTLHLLEELPTTGGARSGPPRRRASHRASIARTGRSGAVRCRPRNALTCCFSPQRSGSAHPGSVRDAEAAGSSPAVPTTKMLVRAWEQAGASTSVASSRVSFRASCVFKPRQQNGVAHQRHNGLAPRSRPVLARGGISG